MKCRIEAGCIRNNNNKRKNVCLWFIFLAQDLNVVHAAFYQFFFLLLLFSSQSHLAWHCRSSPFDCFILITFVIWNVALANGFFFVMCGIRLIEVAKKQKLFNIFNTFSSQLLSQSILKFHQNIDRILSVRRVRRTPNAYYRIFSTIFFETTINIICLYLFMAKESVVVAIKSNFSTRLVVNFFFHAPPIFVRKP